MPPIKPNNTVDEFKAIKELREDQSRVVLTTDKGVAMVIMDKKEYMDKAIGLLSDTNTYMIISRDPTNEHKNNLIGILKDIKANRWTQGLNLFQNVPYQCSAPTVLWSPQNPQSWHPLRPIVSSRGSITYGVAKELASIIHPLVGQSQHHLKNTQHFIQQIQQVKLEQGEVISSYDVKALFTSVPVDPSINIVKQRLTQDPTLPQRTQMSIPQIVTLLEFCLKNTYFLFQGKYYEQVHGAAMGSPISPLIANLFMEEFEVKALSTAPHPLSPLGKVCG